MIESKLKCDHFNPEWYDNLGISGVLLFCTWLARYTPERVLLCTALTLTLLDKRLPEQIVEKLTECSNILTLEGV
mgnify:CR=1 FL=1